MKLTFTAAVLFASASAQIPAIRNSAINFNSDFRFQHNSLTQDKPGCPAPYTGINSLIPKEERATIYYAESANQ